MAQSLEAIFYRGNDQNRTDYTPNADTANGKIVDLGVLAGVVTTPGGLAADKLGSVATSGVFKVKKDPNGSINFAKSALVYFDTVTRYAVTAGGSNKIFLGVSDEAAVNADDHVKVDLNRAPVQSTDARLLAGSL